MLNLIVCIAMAQAQPALQAPDTKPENPQMGPVLPTGFNEAFLQTVLKVEKQIEQGNFAAAKATAALLPKAAVRIEWDDSKVPAIRRQELAAARDKALSAWKRMQPQFKWTFGKPADIRFTFVPSLPPNADTPLPAGAVQFVSDNPADPRIEVVIALKRGSPPQTVESTDVHNEVGYGLAMYYGMVRGLGFGPFATRTEASTSRYTAPGKNELLNARTALDTATKLRGMIAEKKKLIAAHPQIRIDPAALSGASASQGEVVPYTLQITNLGNSLLRVAATPDCGCVVTSQPGQIPANGGSALLQIQVDTTEFVGDLAKKILIYSNDPESPVTHVPIKLSVKPRYRIIAPTGNVALLGSNGGIYTLYFIPAEGSGLEPVQAAIEGIEGIQSDVTVTSWSGDLADPEINEPEKPRTGYRIVVDYGPGLPAGRSLSSLTLKTNAVELWGEKLGQKFETLRRPIQVQNGILANPENLNVGEIARIPQRFHFFVTRPNSGFKIVKLESSNPHLSVSSAPFREDWDYRVTVQFDGKSDYGLLEAKLTVRTSDKKNPVIVVPFRAVVR